jgi:hypothetical protein
MGEHRETFRTCQVRHRRVEGRGPGVVEVRETEVRGAQQFQVGRQVRRDGGGVKAIHGPLRDLLQAVVPDLRAEEELGRRPVFLSHSPVARRLWTSPPSP